MGGAFARGYYCVVAREAITSDIRGGVVKAGGFPRRCAPVAIFADVGRLNMGGSFACCILVIVTGETAGRYARVVKGHCGPKRGALVAIIADVRSLQVGLAFAGGQRMRAAVAIKTLTLALSVIKADDW